MSGVTQLHKVQLTDYQEIIGEEEVDSITTLIEKLKRRSIVHVNSTSFGGGVAEILHRMVPLMRGIGLDTRWDVIKGSSNFFDVTKKFHNALQGMKVQITDEDKNIYMEYNKINSESINLDADFIIIHDAQPAAMIQFHSRRAGKWIWRCHIDLSRPNQEFLNFIAPFVLEYDSLVFTIEQFVQEPLKAKKVALIPPSIDPLSAKNKPLSQNLILSVLDKYDMDAEKPIMTQVARFDPWKDPLGVIDVYRIVQRKIPKVQLLLIASMAKDDPEGWTYYEKTARHAAEDYNIHLLTDLKGVGDIEVNAFQRASDVVLQKSIREGFGLSVTEALWKEVPVIGGNVGGIPLQVLHGKTGFLVNSIEEAAEKALWLLRHPAEAKKMGKQGREHILKNFLITRHLKDYLRLFSSLSEESVG